MTEHPTHLIIFTCSFCDSTFADALPLRVTSVQPVDGCKRCTVSATAKCGMKIVYGAAHHRTDGAQYADQRLIRGETYTLARIKRWQHGAFVYLQETGTAMFNLRLFVPGGFVSPTTPY